MNKKILSLLLLLIVLITVTISYAYFSQPAVKDTNPSDGNGDIDPDTFSSEVDSTFLDENEEIEIGEMI
jgi:hypothetical protein